MVRPGIELEGKRVLVRGTGAHGHRHGAILRRARRPVTATDDRAGRAVRRGHARNCAPPAARSNSGGHRATDDAFAAQDLIVPSPGVPANHPGLVAARAAGMPVWSEIELAWRFLRGRLVGLTGSNGKTTTTSLIGHILASAGLPVDRRRKYRHAA